MKRIIKISLIALFTLTSIVSFSQRRFMTGVYYNGYWGKNWREPSGLLIEGTFDEFIVYYYHPGNFTIRVKINYMPSEIPKKIMKMRLKSGEWYEYSGTIEYFTRSGTSDITKDIERWTSAPSGNDEGVIKVTKPATIRIMPYKKNPETYNILFDNVGIGITLL